MSNSKRKGQYEELSDEEDQDQDQDEDGIDAEVGDQEIEGVGGGGSQSGPILDARSPAMHKNSPVAYLESLSKDPNYRACITLSKIVKVCVFSPDREALLIQS